MDFRRMDGLGWMDKGGLKWMDGLRWIKMDEWMDGWIKIN